MKVGLRIDVDTYRGTRIGVPNLLELLRAHSIKASVFFSVGPDNMGRHLWRLLRPTFFWKMLRTRAASLYGWDILLKGTVWPGPRIGERLGGVIRAAFDEGHEVGLHAWDHYTWQTHVERLDCDTICRSLEQGVDLLTRILGTPPSCSAAPGWKCTDSVLLAKSRFEFEYNSDCRGESIFRPVSGDRLLQPQIPVDLPTYDELVGSGGITQDGFNAHLLSRLDAEKLNVLTIHAEVEGIACLDLFDEFLRMARPIGVVFVPLGALLRSTAVICRGRVIRQSVPGRDGWVARQGPISGEEVA